jgi:hypothetical protein
MGWLFPAPPLEDLTSESYESLREKYRTRDRLGNLAGFLAFVGVAVVSYFVFSWIGRWSAQRFASAKFLLEPNSIVYIVMSAFLSLVSSTYFLLLCLRWYLGPVEYEIYMAYGARRLQPGRFHAGKAFQWIFVLLFPPMCAFFVLYVMTFTAFTEKSMIEAPFGSFGATTERPYSDVRNIYFARRYHARFEAVEAPRYVIVFNDGYQWRTETAANGANVDEQASMVEFVAKQTQHQIINVAFIEDIPK